MKLTYRDIVWFAIVALIVVYLSKCHRDKEHDNARELINAAKTKDSIHKVEQQRADNKLNVLLGQMQNASEKQQATERQLTVSLATISRLSAAVKAAKEFPLDTSFTMVSPEYVSYCDSLAITSEKVYGEYVDYKHKTGVALTSKDTVIRMQEGMLKQERSGYAQCRKDYNALQQAFSKTQLKPRNQLYVGAELIGNQYILIQNVGAVLSLKTKTNKIWQLSGGVLSNGGYYGRINGNILISFKK